MANSNANLNVNVNIPQAPRLSAQMESHIHTPNIQMHIDNVNDNQQSGVYSNESLQPELTVGQPGNPNVVIVNNDPPAQFSVNLNPAQEGVCGHPCPRLEPQTGLIILILNIIFPGLGTMIVGCIGRNVNCCAWVLIGIGQSLLTVCIVGWIWSILVGIQIYH